MSEQLKPQIKQNAIQNNTSTKAISLPLWIPANKSAEAYEFAERVRSTYNIAKTVPIKDILNTTKNVFDLQLNPTENHFYIVTGTSAMYHVISESGYMELLRRTGKVLNYQREVITTQHSWNPNTKCWERDMSKILESKKTTGYFIDITLKDDNGNPYRIWDGCNVAEMKVIAEEIKKANNNKETAAWKNHFDQMAMKTLVKRLITYKVLKAPNITWKSKDLYYAIQTDESIVQEVNANTQVIKYPAGYSNKPKTISTLEELNKEVIISQEQTEASESIKVEELNTVIEYTNNNESIVEYDEPIKAIEENIINISIDNVQEIEVLDNEFSQMYNEIIKLDPSNIFIEQEEERFNSELKVIYPNNNTMYDYLLNDFLDHVSKKEQVMYRKKLQNILKEINNAK